MSRKVIIDMDVLCNRCTFGTTGTCELNECVYSDYIQKYKEEKTGRWVDQKEHCEQFGDFQFRSHEYYWCSECNCMIERNQFFFSSYNYCPKCGAKMEEA